MAEQSQSHHRGHRHQRIALRTSKHGLVGYRSGVCRFLVLIVVRPSCPPSGRQDSHSIWINQPGSRHPDRAGRLIDKYVDSAIDEGL